MSPIAFAGQPLDRADPIRTDPERLTALMADGALLLRLEGLLPELDDEVSLELLPSVDVLSDELDSDFDEDARLSVL